MMISDSLLAAFLNTNYVVFAPNADVGLRIGQYNADLSKLMSERNANSVAILTAYNPGAVPADAEANHEAQKLLLDSIHKLNASYLFGENVAPNGDGPREPTIAVMGMQLEQARILAEQFRQLAFVFSNASAIPELVWTYY